MSDIIKLPLNLNSIVCGCVGLFLFMSCSSSKHIEKRRSNETYAALGLYRDRNDNVALYTAAASWLHVPHVDGGMSHSGVDCSFLVYTIYKTVYGKTIERNSLAMLLKNCERINRDKLKEGDLAFFNTSGKSKAYVNHVGIYLKNNKFLHTSTSKGVVVSDLDEEYYRRTWVCGGRVR
ncbi:MAG: NlpC/P60 family protein [Hungatella sp.]|nr:NlpC/P60 family protein [Hungatella sp.]MTK06585.1 NlpC/P60 family protein [Hungatella sp.]